MTQKKKTIKTYRTKTVVSVFDKERKQYAYQRHKHRAERSIVLRTLKDGIKVLDVACGTGRMGIEILQSGKKVQYHGLDTSKVMVGEFKKKIKTVKPKNKPIFHFADATKMPFKSNTFDVVFSYHLLWHLPKKTQEKIIKEMIRVTKKGGIIIFDYINKQFTYDGFKKIVGKKPTPGIYKLRAADVETIIAPQKVRHTYKLLDAPIKNSALYHMLNISNHLSPILPKNLYHMLFVKVKKK